MFSKYEIEYLKGNKAVNNGYGRVLTYRILKKLAKFEEILPPLTMNEKTRK